MRTSLMHAIEAAALATLFTAFRTLPLDAASWMGGWMARAIGPYLSAHKTARKNLIAVFPELSAKEIDALLVRMWDHLGRVAAEFPHLQHDALIKRVAVSGGEHLAPTGKAAFLLSGHLGNWELLTWTGRTQGRPLTAVYREANNKRVDRMIARLRATRAGNLLPKGRQGAVKMARAIRNGETIAMLVDQKMNDGMMVPFFGRGAMTAPAIAELSLRYGMPIIPARIMRTRGAHFAATIYPPLAYEKTGDEAHDTLAMMTAINAMLEGWIREYPEQWFWVHKRWPNG